MAEGQSGEFDEIQLEPLSDAASQAEARVRQRYAHTWVDQQIRQAIDRGEFDDLPGRGKPIEGLGEEHDPDWWLRKLVERERLVVLPPSVQLRKDDAELDDLLDRQATEREARTVVEDFNARVLRARYGIPTGPPLITQTRDVEATLAAWRERRTARAAADPPAESRPAERHGWAWWRRRHRRA